jgi:hypothetical protein
MIYTSNSESKHMEALVPFDSTKMDKSSTMKWLLNTRNTIVFADQRYCFAGIVSRRCESGGEQCAIEDGVSWIDSNLNNKYIHI